MPSAASQPIDIATAVRAVAGLQQSNMRLISADAAASAALAAASLVVAITAPLPLAILAFGVAVLSVYRAAMMSHEIVHMGPRCPTPFWWAWNLLVGVPTMMPSFIIEMHLAHHTVADYGTPRDPEYSPYGRMGPALFLSFIAGSPMALPFLFVRHLILVPVAAVVPAVRRIVDRRLSAGAIHAAYVRPDAPFGRANRIVEGLAFLWCVGLVVGAATGVLTLKALAIYGAVLCAAVFVNAVRTVVSHKFAVDGPVSWNGQVMDTINLDGKSVWNEILAPLGMRYHATHHMFPRIPYHNLPRAHRNLMAAFGEGSAYASLSRPNLPTALKDLWCRSNDAAAAGAKTIA